VNRCQDATFYTGMSLFGADASGPCAANACGVCDCEAEDEHSLWLGNNWSRIGNRLNLGDVNTDYCVQGDTLWIGGNDDSGRPRAAYKFSKHSCQGTTIPCGQRTAAQCELGSCSAGHCKGKLPSHLGCDVAQSETDCGVIEGCVWDPVGCFGEATPECNFDVCDTEPGCSWGPPKQRCAGEALPCCQGLIAEAGECGLLSAANCSKGAGCALVAGTCLGQPSCSAQKDAATCSALGCDFPAGCKTTECSTLSVGDCHSVKGCRVEW
jgi:hypothetical protein